MLETEGAELFEKCVSPDVESRIFNMLWTLKKQGIKERSIETYRYCLQQLIRHGANLLDVESVKDAIARQEWNDNTKSLARARMLLGTFKPAFWALVLSAEFAASRATPHRDFAAAGALKFGGFCAWRDHLVA